MLNFNTFFGSSPRVRPPFDIGRRVKQRAVARRYAAALTESVQRSDELEDLLQKLQELNTILLSSAELREVLENPLFGLDNKFTVLEAVFEKLAFQDYLRKFVRLLVENKRIAHLPEVLEAFKKAVDEATHQISAEAITPVPITDEQETDLKQQIGKMTGKNVNLQKKLDPEVLGGLCVIIGSRVYDGTLKNQILLMKKRLIEGYE